MTKIVFRIINNQLLTANCKLIFPYLSAYGIKSGVTHETGPFLSIFAALPKIDFCI